MKKVCALFLVVCVIFAVTGCGQKPGENSASGVQRETCSGVVADRFTEGSGGNLKDCLKVETGENGARIFTLTASTEIIGAETALVGDTVEIECRVSPDSDYRPIIKMTVSPHKSNLAHMVMVNGALYYDTGRESTLDARCGNMDGEITSSVDGSEIPAEDGQSNFGSGFGYQFGESGTIEVHINGKWCVFEQRWVEYTFNDSERNVTFSIGYPEGWKLTELLGYDGDETRDASPAVGVQFAFFGSEEELFVVEATLFSPAGVDESMFEAEPFETGAGLAGVKYTRETGGRMLVHYVFGEDGPLPRYTAVASMSTGAWEAVKNDIDAVMKTLKIPAD